MRTFRKNGGFSLIESIIVTAIVAVLASAFVAVTVPMINFYFYYPQSTRVNAAAADLMQIILEGDEKAKGLRYAGLKCTIGGAGGGASGITAASTAGTVQTLTYNYVDPDYCGTNAARVSHTVTLAFDSSTGKVTRAIDGGTAQYIPNYVNAASDITFNAPSGSTDFFHYFGADGTTDLGPSPLNTSPAIGQALGGNQASGGGSRNLVATLSAGAAVGDLVVVAVSTDGGASGPFICYDSKNNGPSAFYSLARNYVPANDNATVVRVMIFYAVLTTALAVNDTITVDWTTATIVAKSMSATSFTGVNILDATNANGRNNSPNTTPNSGNATTTVANELLFGAIATEGPDDLVFTPTVEVPPWNINPPNDEFTTHATAASNASMQALYRVVSATGNYPVSATITSRDWSAAIATFYGSPIGRVDIDVIAKQGSGSVSADVGQIRLKSGVEIKQYTT